MPRGGRHAGTLKPTWNAGKTVSIRVPEAKKDEIRALARAIDAIEGEAVVMEKEMFLQALVILEEALEQPANKGGRIKEKVRQAIALLKP